MRVAQVSMNQDMSFGRASAKDLKAVRRLAENGYRIVEKHNAWQVIRDGQVVSEIPGRRQNYSKIAKQLLG